MNRAFLIIAIPAFVVTFCWLTIGYGLRVAVPVVAAELAVAAGAVIYLRRRNPAAGR